MKSKLLVYNLNFLIPNFKKCVQIYSNINNNNEITIGQFTNLNIDIYNMVLQNIFYCSTTISKYIPKCKIKSN